MEDSGSIFTIGHSTHELAYFLGLLDRAGITAVADVRSAPFSRLPHFNRESLEGVLKQKGIDYVPLGREFGARREEPECYVDGEAVYELIAKLPMFQEGIARVLRGARRRVIALMCSEKEPLDCHRTVLICRHLRNRGLAIRHILADGSLESHSDLERRLMETAGMSPAQGSLFLNAAELLEQAYEARGHEIAYRLDLQGATE
jgi:uncharacterized protein (DUF488 family)